MPLVRRIRDSIPFMFSITMVRDIEKYFSTAHMAIVALLLHFVASVSLSSAAVVLF